MNNQGTLIIRLFLLSCLFVASCYPAYQSHISDYENIYNTISPVPDYSDLRYWSAHPWIKDPSDSLPQILKSEKRDSVVDVFFVHPTTLTSETTEGLQWNASLTDATLNSKTDYTSILYQASVFNQHARVFAPRYRQAHLYSFFTTDTLKAKAALDLAYEDVKSAFAYYLKYYNNGRPIIIASHSQGTYHSLRLLSDYFENKPLRSQLVCAYIIGLAVPKQAFNSLHPCTDSSQTGCFVTWRTFKDGYLINYVQNEKNSSWVVNPLNWRMDSLPVSKKENKGALLFDYKKIRKNSNSAEISHGIIWTNRPRFPFSFFLLAGKKNYHIGDINLFYMNVRENVETRINSFLKSTN